MEEGGDNGVGLCSFLPVVFIGSGGVSFGGEWMPLSDRNFFCRMGRTGREKRGEREVVNVVE